MIASKLHSPPWWPSAAPGTSYGVAPSRSATATTWSPRTYKNSASGSTNRLISHGQATRSTFGRSRVTHFTISLLVLLLPRELLGRAHLPEDGEQGQVVDGLQAAGDQERQPEGGDGECCTGKDWRNSRGRRAGHGRQ